MLAQDEYNPDNLRKKNASPWVHVKKTG